MEHYQLRNGAINRILIDNAARDGQLTGGTKTEDSTGYVALPQRLAAELALWLESSPVDPQGFVFPSEIPGRAMDHKNFLRRNLKPAAQRAGIEGSANFQALRRTTATHVPQVGGSVKDAQAMLRHSSPQTTQNVYMQSIPESVRATVERLDAHLTGKPTVQ